MGALVFLTVAAAALVVVTWLYESPRPRRMMARWRRRRLTSRALRAMRVERDHWHALRRASR